MDSFAQSIPVVLGTFLLLMFVIIMIYNVILRMCSCMNEENKTVDHGAEINTSSYIFTEEGLIPLTSVTAVTTHFLHQEDLRFDLPPSYSRLNSSVYQPLPSRTDITPPCYSTIAKSGILS